MKGLGLDLCQVSRIEKALSESEGFLNRYYAQEEREYLQTRGKMAGQSAAAMFAAKEAFLKAAGIGIGQGVALAEIIIAHKPGGAPFYRVTGAAKKRMEQMGVQNVYLSLTHENGLAAAVCLME